MQLISENATLYDITSTPIGVLFNTKFGQAQTELLLERDKAYLLVSPPKELK